MASAAILSLDEFRDRQGCAAIRQRLHDRFEQWLDKVEAHVMKPTPTLQDLTEAVLALRGELTQAVTEGLVEQRHRVGLEQRTAVCPRCGQALSARGPKGWTVRRLGGATRDR